MTLRNQQRAENKTGHKDRKATRADTTRRLKELGFKTAYDYFCHKVLGTSANYDECMLWEFAKKDDGYGLVTVDGVSRSTHRTSLELKLGRLLRKEEEACHRCDNPSCYNPNHLFVGTKRDNMRDMHAKGRSNTEFKRIKQTTRNAIRNLYVSGWNRSVIAETFDVSHHVVYDITKDINIERIAALQKKMEEQA